jgi:hypothetical protein
MMDLRNTEEDKGPHTLMTIVLLSNGFIREDRKFTVRETAEWQYEFFTSIRKEHHRDGMF